MQYSLKMENSKGGGGESVAKSGPIPLSSTTADIRSEVTQVNTGSGSWPLFELEKETCFDVDGFLFRRPLGD